MPSSLTSNVNYPNNPSGSQQLTSLEGPTNFGDGYGTRIRGYIHPPISGAYTFWLASDDGGDLFLSTGTDPANATRIAFVDSWTNPHEWTKLPSQQSVAINLVAGQKYYIEVLHVEAGGGDNVSVAWQGPGIPQQVIPGTYLSPFVPGTGGTRTLTVTKAGTGSGTVTSSPSGISCGATCTASFTSGASVTLTASAASGSTFTGLERCLHRHRDLHRADDGGAVGDCHLHHQRHQPDPHGHQGRHRHRHRHLVARRDQLRRAPAARATPAGPR